VTECQGGYAQMEKETLAIVFVCKQFNQHQYGKEIAKKSKLKQTTSRWKQSLPSLLPEHHPESSAYYFAYSLTT